MIADNPTHLNCPFCPAQAFPGVHLVMDNLNLRKYVCPAQHAFFIFTEDTTFKYGWNEEANERRDFERDFINNPREHA